MFLSSQTPVAPVSSSTVHRCSPLKPTLPLPPLFSTRRPPNFSITTRKSPLFLVNSEATSNNNNAPLPKTADSAPPITLVGQDSVPLEGVIQFEKSSFSARLDKWGRVALLAGGDVLALLLFSAIGRFSHGFSVVDVETLRTADPFIAGWVLSAYFLGGYGEDGRGVNGLSQAVIAAAKSWIVGIPLGIIIRGLAAGHVPPTSFILVTMGSTSVLLIGWRTLLYSIFPNDQRKKNDIYKRGSPFELFELLTSLIRRW
ncbi:hypothetical protein DCAR_0311141 [Daucus carota subsp. sativus]|uniref:Transmembrane protein n=1 Tax=Daucus carota subsp. sativus TaxID=79200 RepID=A0AAF0WNL3_DAUCS|nr:PREDICTED: uncharacterized protein LOC108211191 [Daucus carota subsp. sativus]WOG91886.1 hypothetical protein DCAR_0311141 [Daucus carota subsp. sativus]